MSKPCIGIFLEYNINDTGVIDSWKACPYHTTNVREGQDVKSLAQYLTQKDMTLIVVAPGISVLAFLLKTELTGYKENKKGKGYSFRNQSVRLRDIGKFILDLKEYTIETMQQAFEPILTLTDWSSMPVSINSIVRSVLNEELLNVKDGDDEEAQKTKRRYQQVIRCTKMTALELITLEEAKRGGLNLCNADYIGKKVKNVNCYDVTSQYPRLFETEEFPQGAPTIKYNLTKKELNFITQSSAVLMKVKFTNIRLVGKFPYIKALSARLALRYCENPQKAYVELLVSAKEATVMLWDKELYEIVQELYVWDDMEIELALCYHKGMLPPSFRKAVLRYYKAKTELKGINDPESKRKYGASKIILNALTGNFQMRPVDPDELGHKLGKSSNEYNDQLGGFTSEEIQEALDADYNHINKETKYYRRHWSYPQGVYLTMLGRVMIMKEILNHPDSFLYSDTDSAYFAEDLSRYFERVNHEFYVDIICSLLRHGITRDDFIPRNKNGEPKMLGAFEEDKYTCFKMLGTKRYLKQTPEGEVILTHSGLITQPSLAKLVETAWNKGVDVFDAYTDDFKGVTAPCRMRLEDERGNKAPLRQISSEEEMLLARMGLEI